MYYHYLTWDMGFSNHYIFATQCRRYQINRHVQLRIMLDQLYQEFRPLGCKDLASLENLSLWQRNILIYGLIDL